MSGTLWIGFLLFIGIITLELLAPKRLYEGFQTAVGVISPAAPVAVPQPESAISSLVQRRADVGPGREHKGWIQDARYFSGYADVQRFGFKKDFCRVVSASGEEHAFFACALAGTGTASPYSFRTRTVSEGMRLSRDDYMRDILGDGREAYCRILKHEDNTFQPLCLYSLDTGFHAEERIDPNPPDEIVTLLDFYSGCQMWLRLRDDLLDYIGQGSTILQFAGRMSIDPRPRPTVTRGLQFNGKDQFVRFGDRSDLTLGNRIPMRKVRAFSVWAYFDEFTNNAHIFDFGDGAGRNNVFLGILGKGEAGEDVYALRPASKCAETTVPKPPTGAQWCPEMRAQELLAQSAGNIDEYSCPGPEIEARRLPPTTAAIPVATGPVSRATLLFEIWDSRLRKVQVKLNRAVPLRRWTHIVVTAANMDAMRPDLQFWINGNLVYVHEAGFLPQAKTTTHNYLGKSNWANDLSEFELRDELFAGSLFDFRMYTSIMSESRVKRTLQWGMRHLGLDLGYLTAGAQSNIRGSSASGPSGPSGPSELSRPRTAKQLDLFLRTPMK